MELLETVLLKSIHFFSNVNKLYFSAEISKSLN